MTAANRPDEDVPERWTASVVYPNMWVDPDADPREGGPEPRDERSTVLSYLRAYRLTMEMKCADLEPGQLAMRSVPPSTMSLLGLIRHMAEVEVVPTFVGFGGGPPPDVYQLVDVLASNQRHRTRKGTTTDVQEKGTARRGDAA
jgi:hypothetical protein